MQHFRLLVLVPYQDLVSKSLKSVKYPSLTAEMLSLCKIFACAEEWLSFTRVHVLTAQKATNTNCLC